MFELGTPGRLQDALALDKLTRDITNDRQLSQEAQVYGVVMLLIRNASSQPLPPGNLSPWHFDVSGCFVLFLHVLSCLKRHFSQAAPMCATSEPVAINADVGSNCSYGPAHFRSNALNPGTLSLSASFLSGSIASWGRGTYFTIPQDVLLISFISLCAVRKFVLLSFALA